MNTLDRLFKVRRTLIDLIGIGSWDGEKEMLCNLDRAIGDLINVRVFDPAAHLLSSHETLSDVTGDDDGELADVLSQFAAGKWSAWIGRRLVTRRQVERKP